MSNNSLGGQKAPYGSSQMLTRQRRLNAVALGVAANPLTPKVLLGNGTTASSALGFALVRSTVQIQNDITHIVNKFQ